MSLELVKRVKLAAGNSTEDRVLAYLEENASEVLAEKINAGKKTLAGAVRYATAEARKLADGGGCVCVDDDTVFGWIIHFFEEDEIAEPKKGSPMKGARTAGKAKPTKNEKPKPAGPICMDLFSGEEVSAK